MEPTIKFERAVPELREMNIGLQTSLKQRERALEASEKLVKLDRAIRALVVSMVAMTEDLQKIDTEMSATDQLSEYGTTAAIEWTKLRRIMTELTHQEFKRDNLLRSLTQPKEADQ